MIEATSTLTRAESLAAIVRHMHLVPRQAEQKSERLGRLHIIIDDEHFGHGILQQGIPGACAVPADRRAVASDSCRAVVSLSGSMVMVPVSSRLLRVSAELLLKPRASTCGSSHRRCIEAISRGVPIRRRPRQLSEKPARPLGKDSAEAARSSVGAVAQDRAGANSLFTGVA